MVTKSQNKLSCDQVSSTVAAFDEWLETQSEVVQETVRAHINLLTKAIPNLGEKSVKILLAGVYLRVLEVTRLPATPKGAIPPVLVIVEDV